MNWLILISTLLLLSSFLRAEDNVLVLTDKNFEETIKAKQVIMVKFYAPWCQDCKTFAPEYIKAAKKIKDQGKPYVLAEIDATENSVTSEKYEITGYPTTKLFIDGKPIDFEGDRTAEAVIAFITRKMSPPSAELNEAAKLKEVKEGSGLRVRNGS